MRSWIRLFYFSMNGHSIILSCNLRNTFFSTRHLQAWEQNIYGWNHIWLRTIMTYCQHSVDMETSTNGAQLQQFLCALQLMRTCILKFSKLFPTLQDLMTLVYQDAGTRTKVLWPRFRFPMWAATIHDDAFKCCQRSIRHQVQLAHRDPE